MLCPSPEAIVRCSSPNVKHPFSRYAEPFDLLGAPTSLTRRRASRTRTSPRMRLAAWPIIFWARWRSSLRFERKRDHFSFDTLMLVILQRGQNDLRTPGIGAMHCLSVVAQRLVGEALRVAVLLGTFGPRASVAMQRHPSNAQQLATAIELGCPGIGRRCADAGEQGAFERQRPQQGFQPRPNRKAGQGVGLLAAVRQRAGFPIHVLTGEQGTVGLGGPNLLRHYPFSHSFSRSFSHSARVGIGPHFTRSGTPVWRSAFFCMSLFCRGSEVVTGPPPPSAPHHSDTHRPSGPSMAHLPFLTSGN